MEMTFGKKRYSVFETYWILYKGLRSMRHLSAAKKKKELSEKSVERLMLAVTEVNGCWVCSYVHTRIALETGMSNEEIRKLLIGAMDDVPADDVAAILFAQHYADTRGNPSKESWQRIVEIYGRPKALGILAAARAIMIGNAYGIAWTALMSRFRGKPDQRSSILYEASMLLLIVPFVPISFIHAMLANVFRVPIIRFR